MLGKTHLAIGLAASSSVVSAGIVPPAWAVPLVASAALGALLPDIDESNSLIGRKLKVLSYPIKWIFGHRGITHSLVALAAVTALPFLALGVGLPAGPISGSASGGPADLASALALGLFIGYGSHIAADAVTPMGVPLLYPSDAKIRLGLVRTGSEMDQFIGFAMGGLFVFQLISGLL